MIISGIRPAMESSQSWMGMGMTTPRLETPKRHLRLQLQDALAKSRNAKALAMCRDVGCEICDIRMMSRFSRYWMILIQMISDGKLNDIG